MMMTLEEVEEEVEEVEEGSLGWRELEELTQLITAWLPQSKDHYPHLPV